MHFTYQPSESKHLQQGDLIRRTAAVEELLKTVHPHYASSGNYQFFIVLTQSCDLVRRDGVQCKSRYVTIAAVRPLGLVLDREIEKIQHSKVERTLGFCNSDKQSKIVQFMERLLNNNAPDYFYLHREPKVQLNEDHCAFLHLSVTVKSELHYTTLLEARFLSLTQSFQHKLGYLVGNLYSRVGTDDWCPNNCSDKEFRALVNKPITDHRLVIWLEKEVYKKVIKQLEALPAPTLEDFKTSVEHATKSSDRKSEVLKVVSQVLTEMQMPPDVVTKVKLRLENRADFVVAVK